MKKIFTLIAVLCCASVQLMADKVEASKTLPADGKPEHVFTMVSGNGYYSNANTAPTQNEANYGTFAFYAAEGKTDAYYIYSKTANKWLTYAAGASYNNGTNFVKLQDTYEADDYFVLNNYSGDLYEISPVTTGGTTDKYLNWFGGVGNSNPLDGNGTLGLWQDSGAKDGGSRWTFAEVIVVERNYTVTVPEGHTIKIGEQKLANGDTYTIEGSVKKGDITVVAPQGQFAAVAINDIEQTIKVYFANIPKQPATETYVNAVVYPAQQDAVGAAVATETNGVYTLSNNVLAASFVRLGDALYFGGSKAMDLAAGTEIFSVAFGNGENVPASGMKLKSVAVQDLEANPNAVGGAEHFAGKQIVAEYEYAYKEKALKLTWRAVLRDGSHYLRSEMDLTGVDDVDMYNIIPLAYNVDTKAAGSVPAVVGNTRGAVIMSNKIFAGLETPTAYNTVGEATNADDAWQLATSPDPVSLTADSWTEVADGDVPARITEATGAGYPNVLAYKQENIVLKENQKVEVLVKYTSGAHRLNLAGADLLDESGNIAANDYHSGYTGGQHSNNTFSFIAPYDGTFTIRVMIENLTESVNASSTLTTKIYTPKGGVVVNTDIVGIQGLWSRNTTLAAGETWKVAGVVGLIAQDGVQADSNIHKTQKRRSFLAYSERERAVPWRATPVYLTWYELQINRNNAEPGREHLDNTKADDVLDVLNHWKSDLYDRYGVTPSIYIIDDGWDQYGEWKFHKSFPNEMRDMAALAEQMGSGVGAWLGPVGGYGQSGNYRRAYWNDKGGMQLSNPAYYKAFKDAAYNLVMNQGDYRFFKFDGISGQFTSVGPDAGDIGNENAEGIIRLERYVREELREDIFFNTTVGTWASPFWYQFTDATWRQENDHDRIGNNSVNRENWITYRDRLVYQNYVTNSPICPINTLMTHGFILTQYGPPAGDVRDYNHVLNELRCAFVCGSGLVELYNDYQLMNSINDGKLWADLAECIAWQKRNADVLPDIHWVGGNPWNGSKTAIYGWASWNGKKATLALRNGGGKIDKITLTLREALNIPANVKGSIIFRRSFSDQATVGAIPEGEPIDIDEKLTISLRGSSVYSFDGVCSDTEVKKVEGLTLKAENAEMAVKSTMLVKATVAPANATFQALTWTSSDETIATVSNGYVKALKEGEVTITATAIDGSEVSASVTVKVVPEVREPYATNFDKNTKATRSDRYIKSISLTEKDGEAQVVEIGKAQPYIDKSADETCVFRCTPGSELTAVIDRAGGWTNAYVYIDLDHDQQFSFNEGSTDQTGTDVMSFSFYTGSFDNDTDGGVNSAGESITGSGRNTMTLPAFTAPKEAGTYRIRFKMDWNSIDAGGQVAADGTCTGANGFLANGGSIVDATLIVGDATAIEKVEAANGQAAIYDLSGRKLNSVPQRGVYIQNKRKMIK